MKCYRCGYDLTGFDAACPRCARQAAVQEKKTQYLVQIDQCSRCKWFIFQGDTVCSACGTPVDRPERGPVFKPKPARKTLPRQQQIALGVTASAAFIVMLVVVFVRFIVPWLRQ